MKPQTLVRQILLSLIIFLIILISCFSIYRIIKTNNVINEYFDQGRWKRLSADYALTPKQNNMIIFFGDSMTENFGELLETSDSLINMGISGDFTFGLLKRTDAVIRLTPAKLFIMIGINDIIEQVPMWQICDNYEKIIDNISQESPETEIFVQSTLPTYGLEGAISSGSSINRKVIELNRFLQSMCQRRGLTYIDLYSGMVNEQKELRHDLTSDGIHLNEEGYIIWKSVIQLYY
jgi:lysophospholipase L1-like esterase